MSVKIRLQRVGAKHKPYYRVVATDSRVKRSGEVIENLGVYQPIGKDNQFQVKEERVADWLKKGAVPSETILALLKKHKIWQKVTKA